jgi:hypothetical protein
LEASPEITPAVVAALPKSDVKLDSPCAPIKYMHRSFKDGDLYLFFNESAQNQTRTATVNGSGQVQVWDATTGTIHPLAGVAKASGSVGVPLALGPQEARFIVIGALPPGASTPFPTMMDNQSLAALDGDWSIKLGDKQSDSPLKSWQELDGATFNGTAEYHKSFNAPAPTAGQHLYLDLGHVSEVAGVQLNGKDLSARAWPPYVWDVTDSIKSGANALVVQVQVPAAGGRGGGGGGGGQAGGRAGRAGAAGGRGRGAAGGAGRAGGQPAAGGTPETAPNTNAAPANAHGLLGPVRLIAQ